MIPPQPHSSTSEPQGRGTDTHPFISDRRTKEHNTPSLREGWGGLHGGLTPTPLFLTEGQKNIIPPPFGRAGVGFTSPQGRGARDG